MQYKEYKGIRLSRLGMGVMRLPVEDQDDYRTCIGCGSCSRHCPQGFDIPKYMEEMKTMMKKD